MKYPNLKTDMRRINYKSDIPPLLLSLKVDENQITVPECDFIVRFYIEGYEGRHYDCSNIGGVWSNCEPSEDGTKLVCYINNQRLGIGELCAEFHYISPDRRYSDGSQKSVVIIDSTELGVELVEDNGDAVTEEAIDVTLPFIYRTAYEIARDHGYTGTAEDFYSALASVVGIADAEKKRVTAEITRNANEQERIENEENRLNAENERVNAEAQRVRNEAIRGDAEGDRVEQEEDRKAKFEEITAFIATVRANEGNRESNERERQTNEDARITEEAKRVAAEKKRAAEFEQQKLDLSGKIDRSGDEMGGDLIFTDNTGVSFRTSDGGAHTMFNDTDDVAKFTADNGDTFEFKQNETPNKNSSAVVVSENLYNSLDMTLDSMGSALDGDAAYRAEAGDKIFNPDTCKIQRYNSAIGGFEDLCDPIEGKLYANKMTGYIYRWDTKAKKMVFVGGVKAYTKDEADSRFAKLDDATQIVKVKELESYNSINTKSMWIGDEGLLLGGDGNGHLTVEQDEVITDVTLNGKLATKADDVAYGVEWNNGQPTGEMQETTIKDATKNTTALALILGQSYNALESEVEKKADKTELATKVDKTDITQSTGESTTAVMSQKAVSAKLSELESNDESQNREINGLRDQVENYKPIVIEGNVTNAADEEDLTSENGLLKIKNRSSIDGMGYVILRKNIVSGVNTLTQTMINKSNTIYIIQYDFNLGEDITIPANCVLEFDGGSISGDYTITGNILNKYIKPEWFGAKGNGVTDDTRAIQNALNISKEVLFTNNYHVTIITASANSTLISEVNSVIYYTRVILNGDNIKVKGITFDGKMSCEGVNVLGNFATIQNCKFINTKSNGNNNGGVTAALFLGSYYTEKEEITYSNIIIENCIFDTAEPYNTALSNTETTATTARFIRSFSAKNIKIQNNIFKDLVGLKDSDCIHLSALYVNDTEYPFTATTSSQGSANPYNGKRFEDINCQVNGNIFYLNNTKSAIKIFGGNVIISKNVFYSTHTDNTHSQYSIVRCMIANNVNVINNEFIINNTKQLESIIQYNQIRTGIISDNVVTTEGTIESITLLFLHYCDNVQISNNMFSIDANDINIFDCECNGYIVIKNNIFGLNITAESTTTVKMFVPWINHYIYPTNTDNNECFYFINNKIKCFGNTTSFDVVSYANKAICIKDNEINVALANFNITTIPTSGKETITEIGNNICFSSIDVNISSGFNSGDINLIINKANIGKLYMANILKSEISECVFKNQITNYYICFYNSNDNHFKNVRFEEYKTQLRVNAGNCNTYFEDLDSTDEFPKTYIPSGTLNISVNNAKKNIYCVNIGTTQQRPTELILPIGFKFYDTTLKKPIYVNEISGNTITWVDATGTPV